MVVSVPELCAADKIAASEETHLLLGEDPGAQCAEQQVLLPGEREEGGQPGRGGAGGAGVLVRLDGLQHRAAPRPHRLPEDLSRGGLREAEAARPQGGGRGPDGVYRGESLLAGW